MFSAFFSELYIFLRIRTISKCSRNSNSFKEYEFFFIIFTFPPNLIIFSYFNFFLRFQFFLQILTFFSKCHFFTELDFFSGLDPKVFFFQIKTDLFETYLSVFGSVEKPLHFYFLGSPDCNSSLSSVYNSLFWVNCSFDLYPVAAGP